MRIKRIAALTALFLLTAAFVCSLNVFAAPVEETDAPTPTAPVATQGTQPTEPAAPTLPSGAFTPDGQGSVLDYVENETDEKLFYTISTKSGNVFYLVVDEARGEQNVYFLNAVTNAKAARSMRIALSAKRILPNANGNLPRPPTNRQAASLRRTAAISRCMSLSVRRLSQLRASESTLR